MPSDTDVTTALQGMPKLEALHLTYETSIRIFCDPLSDQQRVPPLCPALSSLSVQGLSITAWAGLAPHIEEGFRNYDDSILLNIGTLLEYRQRMKIPLRRLVLKDVEVGALSVGAWKARLRLWVRHVEFHNWWTAISDSDDEDYDAKPSDRISSTDVFALEPGNEWEDRWSTFGSCLLGCIRLDMNEG
jgi:hypothetical protein